MFEMEVNLKMTFLGAVLIIMYVDCSANSQTFNIETLLASACSPVTSCEDLNDINLTSTTHNFNITLTVTWTNQWNVFQMYSYIRSINNKHVDLLIVDEYLTRGFILPLQTSGHPFIILSELFWLKKEEPPPESDDVCCVDWVYIDEFESSQPSDDISNCVGWLDPAEGISTIIKYLQWRVAYIIYDNIHEQDAKEVTANLQSCQFIMNKIDSISIPDILWNIHLDVSLDKDVHIVLLSSLDNIKDILAQANTFDDVHHKSSSIYLRSRWLVSLPKDRVVDDETTDFLEGLGNLVNVAVVDFRQDLSKVDLNVSHNMRDLLEELSSHVMELEFNKDAGTITTVLSEILQSRYERCMDTRVDALYFGGPRGRYLNTVAMVKMTQEVVLRGKNGIFPNVLFALNKRTLTVSFVQWDPFVKRTPLGYEGFCKDLTEHLEAVLNFTARLVEPTDGEWGRKLENGSFTGLVGQLQRQEVDMVVAPLFMLPERNQVIDFSFPFYTDYTTVMLRMPDLKESKWLTLIQPFKWQVHLAIWLSLFSVAALITVLERQNPYYKIKSEKSAFHNLTDSVWYMYGSLLTQGGEHLPTSTTGLTLVSFWLMFSVIIASTYSGNLIAFLTVTIDTPPFDTLQDMLDQTQYKWGTTGGRPFQINLEFERQEQLLKNSTDPLEHAIWEHIKRFNKSDPSVLSPRPEDHLDKVNRGSYAYIGDKSKIEMWTNDVCHLKTFKETFFTRHYAIGLVNNSVYTYLVSKEIITINDLGLLHMWGSKWWSKKGPCQGNLVTEATAISVLDVQSAFYMMIIGIVLSALILGAEKLRVYGSTRCWGRRYSFTRSRSDKYVELTLRKHVRLEPGSADVSELYSNVGAESSPENVAGKLVNTPFNKVYTLEMTPRRVFDNDTDSINQIGDSFCADSTDSGYDDLQLRKKAYMFQDKVPFYLSRISLPTIVGRSRSTSF